MYSELFLATCLLPFLCLVVSNQLSFNSWVTTHVQHRLVNVQLELWSPEPQGAWNIVQCSTPSAHCVSTEHNAKLH